MDKIIIFFLSIILLTPVYSWAQFFGSPDEEKEYYLRQEDREDEREWENNLAREEAFRAEEADRENTMFEQNQEEENAREEAAQSEREERDYQTRKSFFGRDVNPVLKEQEEHKNNGNLFQTDSYDNNRSKREIKEEEDTIRSLLK